MNRDRSERASGLVDRAALDVLRRVADGSYVLLHAHGRVLRVDPVTAATTPVGRHEADTVHALLDSRLVRLDRARSVTVDGAPRAGHSLAMTRHGHHALRTARDTTCDPGGAQ